MKVPSKLSFMKKLSRFTMFSLGGCLDDCRDRTAQSSGFGTRVYNLSDRPVELQIRVGSILKKVHTLKPGSSKRLKCKSIYKAYIPGNSSFGAAGVKNLSYYYDEACQPYIWVHDTGGDSARMVRQQYLSLEDLRNYCEIRVFRDHQRGCLSGIPRCIWYKEVGQKFRSHQDEIDLGFLQLVELLKTMTRRRYIPSCMWYICGNLLVIRAKQASICRLPNRSREKRRFETEPKDTVILFCPLSNCGESLSSFFVLHVQVKSSSKSYSFSSNNSVSFLTESSGISRIIVKMWNSIQSLEKG
ncbi:hypothetical protein ACFE04_012365 [Oxalis oulophora]